jgi:PAP2 superfamily
MKFRSLAFTVTMAIGLDTLAAGSNPVVDWDQIAVSTALAGNQTTSPGSITPGGSGIYLAYVHLAVFNAVNAVDQRYQFYRVKLDAPRHASKEAAAISAAYQTLQYYFPDQAGNLLTQYSASLAAIPDGNAKDKGILVGQAAAAQLIALRNNDGRGANVPYTYPSVPEPGVWIATPPGFLPPLTPWLGQMVPFTMTRASQFLPTNGPPDLGSETWVQDYNQTKLLGAVNSTARTPEQTEIGLFWTAHGGTQYSALFRELAAEHQLSTLESARLFAMMWTAYADGFIGCMNAKYHFSFWRPVTAIQNGDLDGNPDTVADPNWLPLGTTPNHPEFPATHGCVTGAVARIVQLYFGTPHVKLTINSSVTNTARTFTDVRDWENEVFWARIYAGFHYRHSLHEGFRLGHRVSEQVNRKFFKPQHEDD